MPCKFPFFQCGHCYCVGCMHILVKEYSTSGPRCWIRCPICRSTTYHSEISYVNVDVAETSGEDGMDSEAMREAYEKIKGDLSTKMNAVVRALIKIQAEDPAAKTLVFSTWTDVLDILGSALAANDIGFAALHAQRKFKRNLQKFKVNNLTGYGGR